MACWGRQWGSGAMGVVVQHIHGEEANYNCSLAKATEHDNIGN